MRDSQTKEGKDGPFNITKKQTRKPHETISWPEENFRKGEEEKGTWH